MKPTCAGGARPTRSRLLRRPSWRHVARTVCAVAIAVVPALSTATGSLGAGLTSDEVADEIARVQVQADDAAVALQTAQFEAEALAEQLTAAEQAVVDATAVF